MGILRAISPDQDQRIIRTNFYGINCIIRHGGPRRARNLPPDLIRRCGPGVSEPQVRWLLTSPIARRIAVIVKDQMQLVLADRRIGMGLGKDIVGTVIPGSIAFHQLPILFDKDQFIALQLIHVVKLTFGTCAAYKGKH